ncbi:hypothetical protein PATY110618_20490 [Paenibacillus typhae]|uniref:PH domain-containing protein n=2 Tax=Paenibacillus typhae TaxID=1174501 RepID=A0A1G9ACH3_9BACL|nr:hypothetical protein SAMN05216192_13611 [Paenibacillus typhae]
MRMKRIFFVSYKNMILGCLLYLSCSFVPFIIIKFGNYGRTTNIMIVFFWSLFLIVFGYFSYFDKKIYFNEEGVRYQSLLKKKFIGWHEVQEVGIAIYSPLAGNRTVDFLCISTQQAVTGRMLIVMENHSTYMNYRKSLIPLIKKYWSGEIIK